MTSAHSAVRRPLRRAQSANTGATLMLVAVVLVPLLAILALVLDAGNAYRQKRFAQTAADAAAIAGAQEAYRGDTTYSRSAALGEASQHGFTNGVGGVIDSVTLLPAGSVPKTKV